MKSRGFDVRQFYLRPAAMTHAWASGYPWENIIKEYGMAEGNLAMLMMRTADNLRHTANLIDVFPDAAATAREAIGLIMKEPVVEASAISSNANPPVGWRPIQISSTPYSEKSISGTAGTLPGRLASLFRRLASSSFFSSLAIHNPPGSLSPHSANGPPPTATMGTVFNGFSDGEKAMQAPRTGPNVNIRKK
jgi:hypothetical protein